MKNGYIDGKLVVDFIESWAKSEGVSIVNACSALNLNTQSYYGWKNGQCVRRDTVKRLEEKIGKPLVVKAPTIEVDLDKFNQLVDNLLDAHRGRESHIDMAIAVACAKGCLDAILDMQEKEAGL